MANRIITVVLEIEDKEAAKALWKAHLSRDHIVGCTVVSIANGNYIKSFNAVEKVLENEYDAQDVNDLVDSVEKALKDHVVNTYGVRK